ncbi:MAG: HD domain-containing protein [Bacilli bacterium]|nr:HD domain-containing protein [Bacilli bacterium]
MNNELIQYIEEFIFPSYQKNEEGHNLEHIKYVITRSLKFAKTVPNINLDMVFTIASFHDIGHYIDANNHEKVSAEMLKADKQLKKFFTEEQIQIMADAIVDHRASLEYEPRSIYGKIISSADRNTTLESPFKRTYTYRLKHSPNLTIEQLIEESRQHIINKFGNSGYAREKMYFDDPEYQQYLKDITAIASNKDEFAKLFIKINQIKK